MKYAEKMVKYFNEFGAMEGLEFDESEKRLISIFVGMADAAYKRGVDDTLASDRVDCYDELEPKRKEGLKNLRFILGQQCLADLKLISLLRDLACFERDSISRLMICYLYGVITGKRQERARRKGGKSHA